MKTATQKYDADIPEGHGWEETRPFHPEDILLRDKGFVLVERRKGHEPIWKHGKVSDQLLTQREALALCAKVAADAQTPR